MRVHHLWLDPCSRALRLQLHEKKMDFSLKLQKPWEDDENFSTLNPMKDIPVIVDGDSVVCGYIACCEYVEEISKEYRLLGEDAVENAEIRRMIMWCFLKLSKEVSTPLLHEKIFKAFIENTSPDSQKVICACDYMHKHLEYFEWILDKKSFFASHHLTLADFMVAAHLSTLDYINCVPWNKYKEVKNWYARMKSRPSFRPLLEEYIPSLPPPKHYDNLDF